MAAADYRLMTEATGQRIATALESLVNLGDPVTIAHGGTGASTAAAALAALGGVAVTDIVDALTSTATDKPLSANMGKTLNNNIINIVTKYTCVGTTDTSGDISILNMITGRVLVSAIPNRSYGDGTYSSWFAVILGRYVGGAISAKCVNDNNRNLASQKVAIDVYYIDGQQLGSL